MNSVGIDIVPISRVKGWDKDEDYLNKILSKREKKYILGEKKSQKLLATHIAAKEAVMKALGTGWDCEIGWRDIEVVNDINKKLRVRLYSKAKTFLGKRKAFLSTAYAGDMAVAMVILEEKKKPLNPKIKV